MNKNDLHILLHQPQHIAGNDANELNSLLTEFPYFQSARSLHLKSLFLQKSQTYNSALKQTAAYTRDRDILFDFITSSEFVSYKPIFLEPLVSDKKIEEQQIESDQTQLSADTDSLQNNIAHLDNAPILNDEILPEIIEGEKVDDRIDDTVKILEDKLEIGSPLKFSETEKHSFQEWLQLAKTAPIERENNTEKASKEEFLEEKEEQIDSFRQKKIDLIDKFIETNPKISPTKKATPVPVNIEVSVQENSRLMTETLARIYLEQKKYQKAIQAYEILILKYPEKSSFFADQISDIKALQQYNSL